MKSPSYAPDIAANPFVAFETLPVEARYRFMLYEAGFTIMGFIKGPVCRGQLALNVIDDHFWVFFVDPNAIGEQVGAEFLARESKNLSLPSEKGSNALILTTWLEFSRREDDYLRAKSEFLQHKFNKPSKVTYHLPAPAGSAIYVANRSLRGKENTVHRIQDDKIDQ